MSNCKLCFCGIVDCKYCYTFFLELLNTETCDDYLPLEQLTLCYYNSVSDCGLRCRWCCDFSDTGSACPAELPALLLVVPSEVHVGPAGRPVCPAERAGPGHGGPHAAGALPRLHGATAGGQVGRVGRHRNWHRSGIVIPSTCEPVTGVSRLCEADFAYHGVSISL